MESECRSTLCPMDYLNMLALVVVDVCVDGEEEYSGDVVMSFVVGSFHQHWKRGSGLENCIRGNVHKFAAALHVYKFTVVHAVARKLWVVCVHVLWTTPCL